MIPGYWRLRLVSGREVAQHIAGSLADRVLKSLAPKFSCEDTMVKKNTARGIPAATMPSDPMVAAMLTGVIYQARLLNRQARLSIPEQEVVSEVISLWRIVMEALAEESKQMGQNQS
jgi:hypothetical protein